jgi:3D (Asp-Asp-Asp) domain-containing protein
MVVKSILGTRKTTEIVTIMITVITNAIVTVYLATGHLCSDGKMPVPGLTVASSDRTIPLGSSVLIDNRWYKVMDRTNRRFHKEERFDIFTDKPKQWCKEFGKKQLMVYLYENDYSIPQLWCIPGSQIEPKMAYHKNSLKKLRVCRAKCHQ